MKQWILWAMLLTVAGGPLCGTAATIHWIGVGGSGVGYFDAASNWGESTVPGANDFVVVKNFAVNKANWAVAFSNDATNLKAELVASTNNCGLTFNLNGHTWTLTDSAAGIHMNEARGGMLTFSNGTIRTPFFSFTTPPAGTSTNMFLKLKDMVSEVGKTDYAAVQATFEGGSLKVTNSLSIGTVNYGVGTVFLDKGVNVYVTNSLAVGDAVGATGELINVNGQLEHRSAYGAFFIGRAGCGSMTILGGSNFIQQVPYIGYTNTGVGVLTVAGGVNTFGTQGENKMDVGSYGRGSVLAYGGTNYAVGLTLGYNPGGYGGMILTNGSWTFSNYSWIGCFGKGVISISGGTMVSPSTFCIGRQSGGTGIVTVVGGTLDVNSEVRLGGASGSCGSLTLSGTGVLKAGYISELESGAVSSLLFDGGTLQPKWNLASGALIRSVDDIRLTAKGLVVDTVGYDAVITGLLQNASGEAGSITKKGLGTLTLVGTRAATGSVSVLVGTLAMSTPVAVSAGTSRINGTLALSADNRLIVGTGATLAGTGTVARVTLQDNAVFARDKADNATTPLLAGDCASENRLSVVLTGYSLADIKASSIPLISVPAAFVDVGKVTVTLDGQTNPRVKAKMIASGDRQILTAAYSVGTLVAVR